MQPATQSGSADGRRTTPPAGTNHRVAPDHVVQFYETDEFLYKVTARYLADGFGAGQPLLALATGEHRRGIEHHLSDLGLDVPAAVRAGHLTFLDARDTLSGFMSGGLPDPQLFHRSMVRAVRAASRVRNGTHPRVFGEMVDALWREGNAAGAIRLEELWNELAARHRFDLPCAYCLEYFSRPEHTDATCSIRR